MCTLTFYLTERVFTFPLDKGTPHVKLTANIQKPITAMTLCLRFHTDLTRTQSLFSLATPSHASALTLFKSSVSGYKLHINGDSLAVHGQPDIMDEWNSVCWTWDSSTGLTALWVNGKRSVRQVLQKNGSVDNRVSIILGQEQDAFGRGFQQNQSFIGDMADVHLWDSVIVPCQIRHYMEGNDFVAGNLLNWKDLQYTITGTVYVESSDFDKLSCY
uniref:Pentraxin family member n=1 Tax=Myripristis murdjan TaxID=586833 RepID=A0A668AEX2_9TELE